MCNVVRGLRSHLNERDPEDKISKKNLTELKVTIYINKMSEIFYFVYRYLNILNNNYIKNGINYLILINSLIY